MRGRNARAVDTHRCWTNEGADDGQEYPGYFPRRQAAPKFLRIRREDHTADAAGPCPFYPHSRVTAQGGDLLAWLDAAITEREETAQRATQTPWRTHDTHLDLGGHTATVLTGERNDTKLLAWVPTMSHEPWDETRNAWNNAEHIALNDPESVLRRCAADRKILAAYASLLSAASQPEDDRNPLCMPSEEAMEWLDRGSARSSAHEALKLLRPVMEALAEGYGWAEAADSKTPPTEGDQVT